MARIFSFRAFSFSALSRIIMSKLIARMLSPPTQCMGCLDKQELLHAEHQFLTGDQKLSTYVSTSEVSQTATPPSYGAGGCGY